METEYRKRIDEALRSDDPEGQLIELAKAFKVEGMGQYEMYFVFEEPYVEVQEVGGNAADDALTEVLSLIWGWCSRSIALFPENMTNKKAWEYRQSRQ